MESEQPLYGVKAYVDVKSKYANNSLAVSEELIKLGATISDKLDPSVSHVIYKDGYKVTEAKAKKFGIPMVGVAWLDSCKKANAKIGEHTFSVSYNSARRRNQKPLQPKDFTEELQHASDKLAKVKKRRRSGVQIPSPLNTVADRINLNAYLQVPRTPPHMQRKLDELREKNLSSLKHTAPKAASNEEDRRASLGCSPQLPSSQYRSSQVVVPGTTYKAPRCVPDDSGEECSGQEDHVVPETPLRWNLSAQLSLSTSSEKNPSNSSLSICSVNEKKAGGTSLSQSSSPALEWDLSVSSFLNNRSVNKPVHRTAEMDNPLSSDTDETVDCIPGNIQSKSVIKNCGCNNTKESTPQSTRKSLSVLPPSKPLSSKRKKKFVPPFLKPKEKISGGEVSVTDEVCSATSQSSSANQIGNEDSEQLISKIAAKDTKYAVLQVAGSKATADQIQSGDFEKAQEPTVKASMLNSGSSVECVMALHSRTIKQLGTKNVNRQVPVSKKRARRSTSVKRQWRSPLKLRGRALCKAVDFQFSSSPSLDSSGNFTSISPSPLHFAVSQDSQRTTGATSLTNGEVSPVGQDMPLTCGERAVENRKTSIVGGQTLRNEGEHLQVEETPMANGEVSATTSEVSQADSESSLAGREASLADTEVSLTGRRMSCVDTEVSLTDREVPPVDGEVSLANGEVSMASTESSLTESGSKCPLASKDGSFYGVSKSSRKSNQQLLSNIFHTSSDSGVASNSSPNTRRGSSNKNIETNASAIVLPEDQMWLFDSPNHTSSSNRCLDTQPKKNVLKNGLFMDITNRQKDGHRLGKPNLVLTSLHSGDRIMVRSIVKKLGGFQISQTVDRNTSHVVCGDNRRTLNVLKGISYGCWVVSVEWVLVSLEAGKWVDNVEDYLMTAAFSGVTLQRHHRLLTSKNRLFASIGPIYVAHGTIPMPADLRELIRLNGGEVVKSRRACKIMVGTASDVLAYSSVIKENWILDSVAHQKLFDHRPYRWKAELSLNSTACDVFDS
ncbi:microcephalin-like isoform X2 [Watersipora subatra]|uniref:microcephalin-like isoform X2 n=1 Tax=Watersipora subatra TaxID=2589382 RepID=UPI00355B4E8A